MDDDVLNSPITSIHFSKDSKNIAYAAKNGFYKIYNIANSDFVLKGKLSNDYVSSIQFNNESSKVTIGTYKGNIYCYPSPSFQSMNFKIQLNANITYLKYSPLLPDTIGICTEDGAVKILDLVNGEIKNNFSGFHLGEVTCLAFSPVSKIFFGSCGLDGKINFFDINEKKLIKTLNINTSLTSLAFNNEGNQIICGDTKGVVYIYDLRNSDKPKSIFLGNKGRIHYLEVVKKNLIKKGDKGLNESSQSEDTSRILNPNSNSKSQLINNSNSNALNCVNQIDPKRQPLNDKTNLNNTAQNLEMNNSYSKSKGQMALSQDVKKDLSLVNKGIGLEQNDYNQMIIDEEQTTKKTIEQRKYSYILQSQQPQLNQQQQQQQQMYSQKKTMCEIDQNTQKYIKACVENEYTKIKGFIHEELSTLHLDLIRQFEIQQVGIIQNLKSLSLINREKADEIEKLKKENENLKSKFF